MINELDLQVVSAEIDMKLIVKTVQSINGLQTKIIQTDCRILVVSIRHKNWQYVEIK